MIQGMTIRGVATFDKTDGAALTDLRPVNFFYGSNGVGKTSISRLIANPGSHPTCSISWSGGTPLECLVYNRDFVTANFEGDIRGIFTLGKADIAIEARLRNEKAAADECATHIRRLKEVVNGTDGTSGRVGERNKLTSKFVDKCWDAKGKHDDLFKKAFEPDRGSRERFRVRVLSELTKKGGKQAPYEDLERRARALLTQEPTAISRPRVPDASALLAVMQEPLIARPIVGKGDVDVAALIQRLGISDWVKQGVDYFDRDDGTCPFCQQKAPETLSDRLNLFFDETYSRDTARIKQIKVDHEAKVESLVNDLANVETGNYEHLDKSGFDIAFGELKSKLTLNQERLEHKVREPSIRCELEAISPTFERLTDLIKAADTKAREHNQLVESYKDERVQLIADIWRFMLDVELKAAIEHYNEAFEALKIQINDAEAEIQEQTRKAHEHSKQIKELQRSTNSIQPTIDAINALLRSFGFNSFSIGSAGDGRYKLVRADGSDAKGSLSEGERSFVTFLYFYHLLKGSHEDGGGTNPVIVVIDDPVSSLDSDVLFIVSTLVRTVLEDAKSGDQRVRQLFVLTHNVYFHKEVTYVPNRNEKIKSHESFWMVRKPGGVSHVERQTKNPIQTSYQLLWSEVRNAMANNINIQNTLRRILENYFKILGGIDINKLPDKFEGTEKLVCKSLTSWLHDGSHTVHDDVCVALNDSEVTAYLNVFEKIFINEGQVGHYRMMMGLPDQAGDSEVEPQAA